MPNFINKHEHKLKPKKFKQIKTYSNDKVGIKRESLIKHNKKDEPFSKQLIKFSFN